MKPILPILLASCLTSMGQVWGTFPDMTYMGQGRGAASAETFSTNAIGISALDYWNLDTIDTPEPGQYGRVTLGSGNFPSSVTGKVGNAAHFPGAANSVLSAAGSTNFSNSGTNSWSLSMWVRIETEVIPASPPYGGSTLASIWNNQTVDWDRQPERYWKLGYETDGMYFRARVGGIPNGESWALLKLWPTNSTMTNIWVYTSVGYDGETTNFWFQTNAGPRQTFRATNSVMPYVASAGIGVFALGNVSDGSQGFVGDLDEVGYWNRTLTTNEISILYGGGTAPVVWSSSWTNSYYFPTNYPQLFNPASIGGGTLCAHFDILRPETFMGVGKIVAPLSGTQVTNWFDVNDTNLMRHVSSVGGNTGPTYYSSGAGTNSDKPRMLFNVGDHLQVLSAGGGAAHYATTNFIMIVVKDITPTTPDSGGVTIASEQFPVGGQTWFMGETINTASPARGLININLGDGWGTPGPTTLFTNIQVYTLMMSNNSTFYMRTNGVQYYTKSAATPVPFAIGQFNGSHDPSSLVLNASVKWNLCRFWLWRTNLNAAFTITDLQAAENACRSEFGL